MVRRGGRSPSAGQRPQPRIPGSRRTKRKRLQAPYERPCPQAARISTAPPACRRRPSATTGRPARRLLAPRRPARSTGSRSTTRSVCHVPRKGGRCTCNKRRWVSPAPLQVGNAAPYPERSPFMSTEPKTMVQPTTLLARYVTSIDHVAIAVQDLEESIKFYTNVLGFELKERRRTEGKQTAMVSDVLKAGPVTVVLLQGITPESQVSRFVEHFGPGVQHLALGVENLPEVTAELEAAGMEFDTTVISSPGLRQRFS